MIETENKKIICIIGGDKRFTYAAKEFEKADFNIIYAKSEKEAQSAIPLSDFIILPMPVTKDGKNIFGTDKESPLSVESLIKALKNAKKPVLLAGGLIPERLCREISVKTFDYCDEDLKIKNASLTACAAVKKAYGEYQKDFKESRAFVIGWGRIGKPLYHLLKSECKSVTVLTRQPEKLRQMKIRCGDIRDIHGYLPFGDLIFNTAPAQFLHDSALCTMPEGALYIELASVSSVFPGESGKIIKAPGLPGKYYPETAGKIIADKILLYISSLLT